MKIKKSQLRRIIQEEKIKLAELGIDRVSPATPMAPWAEDLTDYIVNHIYTLSTATGLDLEDPEILTDLSAAMDAVKVEFPISSK